MIFFYSLLTFFLLIALGLSQEPILREKFILPSSFNGTWMGSPSHTTFGPYATSSYVFSISASPSEDYLMEVNIEYDSMDTVMGYQRFYIRGSGAQVGKLWYCGSLSNFSDFLEVTLHQYEAQAFPEKTDDSVTFCLDKASNKANDNVNPNFPFYPGCWSCDCSNWTISYDPLHETLTSSLTMHGSQHLYVEMRRIGEPPSVTDDEMPPHEEEFNCQFETGGRDSEPIDRSSNSQKRAAIAGCPHMNALLNGKTEKSIEDGLSSKLFAKQRASSLLTRTSNFTFCYILNKFADFKIEWSLDEVEEMISVRVSATAAFGDDTWVALGFRPLSRSVHQALTAAGTGRHFNFGMKGADIIAGSIGRGIRGLYAQDYAGEPVLDSSLPISDDVVEMIDDRVVLSFTRSYYGGYLLENFGINASIVSSFSDIIWAVGSDSASSSTGDSGCSYHDNRRGMRPINWTSPEIAMMEFWEC